MPLLQESRPAVGWRQRTRADALWLYRSGMLSGEPVRAKFFTSPTPDKIFECAMQIDGGEGVLLIIKNYTGDILNFRNSNRVTAMIAA